MTKSRKYQRELEEVEDRAEAAMSEADKLKSKLRTSTKRVSSMSDLEEDSSDKVRVIPIFVFHRQSLLAVYYFFRLMFPFLVDRLTSTLPLRPSRSLKKGPRLRVCLTANRRALVGLLF